MRSVWRSRVWSKARQGMEQGGIVEPYSVLLLHRDGGSSVYAKYRS